ncbi:MAG: carboxylating nicotinate-nucleotide diphosphorylase [Thermoproteota archaeon]
MAEEMIFKKFTEWLSEDIPFWDLTSELIPPNVSCEAVIIAKEEGVSACCEDIAPVLKKMGFEARILKKSGEEFKAGEQVMWIKGDMRRLLSIERLLLNILSQTFGVATLTKKFIEKARKLDPNVRIAATRKVKPGFQYFEKRAIAAVGGDTHRLNLSDMILIKENHLKYFGSVSEAVRKAKEAASFSSKIEVEVSNAEEAVEAAEAGADIIMLDNCTPEKVENAIKMLEQNGLRNKVLVEVSGGIKLENLEDYVKTGADIISSGELTHSAKIIDISLEVVKVER